MKLVASNISVIISFFIVAFSSGSLFAECSEPPHAATKTITTLLFGKKLYYFVRQAGSSSGKGRCHYLSVYQVKPIINTYGKIESIPVFYYGRLTNGLEFFKKDDYLVVRITSADWESSNAYWETTSDRYYFHTHNRFSLVDDLGGDTVKYESIISELKKLIQSEKIKRSLSLLNESIEALVNDDEIYAQYISNFQTALFIHIARKVDKAYQKSPAMAKKWYAVIQDLKIKKRSNHNKVMEAHCKKITCVSVCVKGKMNCKVPYRVIHSKGLISAQADLGYTLYKLNVLDPAIEVLKAINRKSNIRLADALWKRNKGTDKRKARYLYGNYYVWMLRGKLAHKIPMRVEQRKKFYIHYGDPSAEFDY